MHISQKLALGLATPVLALVAVGVLAERQARSALIASIERGSKERGVALLDEIDRLLLSRISEWAHFVGTPEVQLALAQSNAAMARMRDADAWIDAQDAAWRVALAEGASTERMQAIEATQLSQMLSRHLASLTEAYRYPVYGEAFLTDAYGANAAQTNTTSDFRQNDEDWWLQAREHGLYIGDLEFDESAGVYSTELCLRVRSPDGEFLGVLKAVLDIQDAIRLLSARTKAADARQPVVASLYDRKLRLIHTTRGEGGLAEQASALSKLATPRPGGVMTMRRHDPASGRELVSTLVSSAGSEGFSGSGWYLLLDTDGETALAPVASLQRLIWATTAGVAAIALLIGVLVTRDVSGRIANLARVAMQLGAGQSGARAKDSGDDEIADLAGCLNRMADALARNAAILAQRADVLDRQNAKLAHEMAERQRGEAERLRLEQDLARAQKLESIGRLAAGIAHEINTPAQYVGDNLRFLDESVQSLMALARALPDLIEGEGAELPCAERLESARSCLAAHDLEFLAAEVPSALAHSLEGVSRITSIVKAMKEFSHPGTENKTWVDLNQALRSTATVGRNEWRYVATLEFDLADDLPQVLCLPGEVNQVFLNMIVNAAHAIGDVVENKGALGTIRIATRRIADTVEVRIADTGTGMPPEVARRIFDPLFTTKAVGRGTGQGLAIAHSVIVQRHGGSIEVETRPGSGSTFVIALPIEAARSRALPFAEAPS